MTTKVTKYNHNIKPEIKFSGIIVKNKENKIIKTIKEDENDH